MPADPNRVRDVFLAAIDLSPERRSEYLADACGVDAALRAEVEQLLAADAEPDSLLEPGSSAPQDAAGAFISKLDAETATAMFGDASTRQEPSPITTLGTIIADRYTLVEVIGEGGMGSVYLAEQTEPVKRQVALKLIKAGMDSRAVLARFDAERQALALMDHPNIARIYDGGVTRGEPGGVSPGRPFFVMELVKGVPLTEYCDSKRLSVDARLQLFVSVCQAVQHAHQKGIIHRDLKPGNVLVTEVDGRPTPKVIDFGVAKATEQKLTDMSFLDVGAIVGTPAYMSPEQADPSSMDIDTRTDVYALGVMLYELLVGSPPIDAKQFKRGAILEMLRMVREVEPPRPSSRLSAANARPNIAANRSIEPAKLAKLLQVELDWVVMKALEKDRTRRYETANGFAADVQRYLSGEAVIAHPPSTAYRIRKFVRRNKVQVTAAALVFLALVAGVIGTTVGLVQARQSAERERQAKDREAERAEGEKAAKLDAQQKELLAVAAAAKEREARLEEERQRKFAEAISQFVQEDFLALTSVEGQGRFGGADKEALDRNTTLGQLLDRAAEKLRARKDLDPRTEAELSWIVGVNYRGAGETRKGIEFLERAMKLRTDLLGRDHADTLNAMNSLAMAYNVAGKRDLSLPLYEETLKLKKAKLGSDDPSTITTMNNLAQAYHDAGKVDLALPLMEETLKLAKTKLGPEHPHTLSSMGNLAGAYKDAGKVDLALPLMEETLKLAKTKLGPEHHITLTSMNNLAQTYQDAGKLDLALPLMEETLKLTKARLGPNHPNTLGIMNNLAMAYQNAGKVDLALPLAEETLKLNKAKLGPDHPDTFIIMSNLATMYWSANQLEKSVPLFEEALKHSEARLGRNHRHTLMTVANLGVNYKDAGRVAEAIPLLEEAYLSSKKHPTLGFAGLQLLDAYAKAGKPAEAKKLIDELLTDARKSLPKDSLQLAGQLANVGLRLLELKAFADAEPVLRECLTIREKKEPDAWTTFNTHSLLGGALFGQKKYTDAEPLLLKGYEGLKAREKAIPPQGSTRIPEALDRLIELYIATNKPDEVKKWQVERAKYPAPVEAGPVPRVVMP